MDREEFCQSHWSYYMVLERDFLDTERYVSFDLGDNNTYDGKEIKDFANSEVFSTEFVKQYQAICSEIDVILKTICKEFGCEKAESMPEYTEKVLNKWQDIAEQRVKMNSIELRPFQNWRKAPDYHAPDWWPLYNDVKHDRVSSYRKANLKNVVNALAGLYILEQYIVKFIGDRDHSEDVPDDISKLFEMVDFKTVHTVIGRRQYLITEQEIAAIMDD